MPCAVTQIAESRGKAVQHHLYGAYLRTSHRYTIRSRDSKKTVLNDKFTDVERLGDHIIREFKQAGKVIKFIYIRKEISTLKECRNQFLKAIADLKRTYSYVLPLEVTSCSSSRSSIFFQIFHVS